MCHCNILHNICATVTYYTCFTVVDYNYAIVLHFPCSILLYTTSTIVLHFPCSILLYHKVPLYYIAHVLFEIPHVSLYNIREVQLYNDPLCYITHVPVYYIFTIINNTVFNKNYTCLYILMIL